LLAIEKLMREIFEDLELVKFIALDLETTGLNPNLDSVIEFSAILFVEGKLTERLTFLCDPGFEISNEIETLTGISTQMVKGRAAFESQIPAVLDFIGDLPLVGHNIGFDLGFMKSYLKRSTNYRRVRIKNVLYDTSLLAQAFYFYLHNHRLSTVSDYCGLSTKGAHRAESDALNTGKIFLRLIEEVLKYDLDILQTINMILKDTSDPNKQLYQNAAKRLLLHKSIKSTHGSQIDWRAPINLIGENNSLNKNLKISTGRIRQYFGRDSILSQKLPKFELRPQQQQMADLVMDALSEGKTAVIEAGTGVGKSLAYLIPAILWLKTNAAPKQRVVVACNTKTLQEQLFYKEIPFVIKSLGLKFKAVLLKGRSNYICLTRWNKLLADFGNQVPIANRSSIIPIIIWLKHTKTGDISENNGFKLNKNYMIWNEICSAPGYCTSNVCQKYDGCYLGQVRYHASSANVLVVNHSLLLSDAASENAVLPEYSVLVVDEAHNLEKNSYNYFSARINLPILTSMMNSVLTLSTPERGLIVDLSQLISQYQKSADITQYIQKIFDHINDLKIGANFFYKTIYNHSLKTIQKKNGFTLKKRYKLFQEVFPEITTETNTFIYELSSLINGLKEIVSKVDELVSDYPKGFDDLRLRLTNIINNAEEYLVTLKEVTTGNREELIFWYEINPHYNENGVEFAYTPLDMSETIYEKVLLGKHATILTSATLQIASSFDYLIQRTGVGKIDRNQVIVESVGSPFNYNEQMKFITFQDSSGEAEDASKIATVLLTLAQAFHKGVLALFTSYNTLGNVYRLLQPELKNSEVTLLAQGMGGSRSSILEQFRQLKGSILLGTDSFWEGIDVVGESLEILVISKLPFPVPSEPIIEANVEKIGQSGANPFNDYYVPETVIKFRQGIGRLIRSKTDRGVVINLDERIDRKSYGKFFKQSLPVPALSVTNLVDLINVVSDFFNSG
jgi:ATP-dependent DNA helicase DinG